jgi:hypothetical protein
MRTLIGIWRVSQQGRRAFLTDGSGTAKTKQDHSTVTYSSGRIRPWVVEG